MSATTEATARWTGAARRRGIGALAAAGAVAAALAVGAVADPLAGADLDVAQGGGTTSHRAAARSASARPPSFWSACS